MYKHVKGLVQVPTPFFIELNTYAGEGDPIPCLFFARYNHKGARRGI